MWRVWNRTVHTYSGQRKKSTSGWRLCSFNNVQSGWLFTCSVATWRKIICYWMVCLMILRMIFFSIVPITFNFKLLRFFGWNLNSSCQKDTDTCTFFCYISFVASIKTLRWFSPTRLISFKETSGPLFLHDDHLVAMATMLLTLRN